MLAARARGLGSVWTTFHLRHEREAADLLGIPFATVMQAALIPVAYTVGTDFRPAARHPLDTMVHWDRWSGASRILLRVACWLLSCLWSTRLVLRRVVGRASGAGPGSPPA
jgi:hypothetical protein